MIDAGEVTVNVAEANLDTVEPKQCYCPEAPNHFLIFANPNDCVMHHDMSRPRELFLTKPDLELYADEKPPVSSLAPCRDATLRKEVIEGTLGELTLVESPKNPFTTSHPGGDVNSAIPPPPTSTMGTACAQKYNNRYDQQKPTIKTLPAMSTRDPNGAERKNIQCAPVNVADGHKQAK